jgi:hypothetical protein
MFGDLLFSVIPFSTIDDDYVPEPYSQSWINSCPAENTWEDAETNAIPSIECHRRD